MTTYSKAAQIVGLVGWLGISFVASAIGAVASVQAGSFYSQLVRPAWAPPGWVFGPVWTSLYFLMGVAAWLVWRAGGFQAGRLALTLFLVQLAVNASWSWVFFAWRQGAWSFVVVLLLWLLIVATVIAFWKIRPVAGIVLLPYLLWVTFATALTYSAWRLNPTILG